MVKLFLVTVLLVLSGCCTNNAYKESVAIYASHQSYYARNLKECVKVQSEYSEDCLDFAIKMSALQCLVDEDSKSSTKENMTIACKCSRILNPVENCSLWLDSKSNRK